MSVEYKNLKLIQEVSAGITIANTYVVPSGVVCNVYKFRGNAVYSKNSIVKAVWDYNGNEELIAVTKGDVELDLAFEVTGDGVKKLAVVLENGEAGPIIMECEIMFTEKTL